MKKRLIALMLVLLVCVAFCLTACKKEDTSTIETVADLKEHYALVAEISLACQKVGENDEGYEQKKEQAQLLVEQTINADSAFLEKLMTGVVAQSEIRNKYIENYLTAVKDYVIAKNLLISQAEFLRQKYQGKYEQLQAQVNKTAEQEKQMQSYLEIVNVSKDIRKKNQINYTGLNSVGLVIIKSPLDMASSVDLFKAQAVFTKTNTCLEGDEYLTITNSIKSVYESGVQLANVYDFSAYVNLLINLVLNQSVLDIFYTKAKQEVSAEYLDFLNEQINSVNQVVKVLKEDFGLDKTIKKQAYIDVVVAVLNNSYNYSRSIACGFSYYNAKALLESYYKNDDSSVISYAKQIFDEVGENLIENSLTGEQAEDLISNSKILDKNGLGFFVERYAPLYGYAPEFIGQILVSANVQDIKTLTEIVLLEEGDYNSHKEQLKSLTLTILSKMVTTAYEEWESVDGFNNVWSEAMGEGSQSFISGILKYLGNIATLCPQNSMCAYEKILLTNDYFTDEENKKINENLVLLGFTWRLGDFMAEDVKEAQEAIKVYIEPMQTLGRVLFNDEIDLIKGYLPSTDGIYQKLDKVLNSLI